ncbi:MAG: vitamin K epoxide reductase family protein [Candidatus Doudnabacteria bacterium]|nr:vitamin K epoxide reductase family protein [Candidatus Doudnabacteria bacterium]
MLHRHKHDAIVILAIFGLGVSLYLAITHYLGFAVPCDLTHGCETVLNSKYSMLLGLPLSVWGVAYFFSVAVCALLANYYATWKTLLTWLLGIGAVASLAFLSIQFFVLKKICQYCLTTDLISVLLFLWDINIEHQKT